MWLAVFGVTLVLLISADTAPGWRWFLGGVISQPLFMGIWFFRALRSPDVS